jgi:hypothetical protein
LAAQAVRHSFSDGGPDEFLPSLSTILFGTRQGAAPRGDDLREMMGARLELAGEAGAVDLNRPKCWG